MANKDDQLLRAERDSIAFLALLARTSLQFDPPIPVDIEDAAPTHFVGLNIHVCVADDADGELLGIARNTIHSQNSPLEHGEQRALRAAIVRVNEKRPRQSDETIEQYYRSSMFMATDSDPHTFLRSGATSYTTLEPCPMCASTLLVARMKRVVFILSDKKFGGAWEDLKNRFYPKYELTYGPLELEAGVSDFVDDVRRIHDSLMTEAAALRQKEIRDTHLLDHCRALADMAANLLRETKESDLATKGDDHTRNARLLADVKAACNFPHAS